MHTNRSVQYWVIPPEADAEFAAHMEDVLAVYSRPYDVNAPVLCMDEQPVQLVEEVRVPITATRQHPKRVDYEYKRAGVANVFMFAEPLASWRQVSVRSKKTKVDWALEMGELMAYRHPGFWQPMDTLRDYNHLEELWNSGRAPWMVW